jgi:O-antigen ligase
MVRRGVLELAACGLLIAAVLTASWNGVRVAPGLTASDPLLVGALVCWIAARRRAFQELVAAPLWIVFGGYVLGLSIGMSEIVGAGGVRDALPGLRLLLVMCFVPAVVGTVAEGAQVTGIVAVFWVVGVAVNGLVGVLDSSFGTTIGFSVTGVEAFDRSSGLTSQANHLAVACAMALPFAVSLFLSARGAWLRGVMAVAMAMIVLGCFASGSRAGLAGLACTVGFLGWTQRHAHARTLRLAIVGAVVISVALVCLPGDKGSIAIDRALGRGDAVVGVVQSDRTRGLYREQAEARFRSSPLFGTGFAEFRRAHSVYLQLLAAGGLCALASFLIFLGGAILAGLKLSSDTALSPANARLAGAAATSLLAWGVMGVLSNQIFDRYLFIPVGLLWAVWKAAGNRASVAGRPSTGPFVRPGSSLVPEVHG